MMKTFGRIPSVTTAATILLLSTNVAVVEGRTWRPRPTLIDPLHHHKSFVSSSPSRLVPNAFFPHVRGGGASDEDTADDNINSQLDARGGSTRAAKKYTYRGVKAGGAGDSSVPSSRAATTSAASSSAASSASQQQSSSKSDDGADQLAQSKVELKAEVKQHKAELKAEAKLHRAEEKAEAKLHRLEERVEAKQHRKEEKIHRKEEKARIKEEKKRHKQIAKKLKVRRRKR